MEVTLHVYQPAKIMRVKSVINNKRERSRERERERERDRERETERETKKQTKREIYKLPNEPALKFSLF